MPVILNASTSSGLVLTPDTSGVLEFQNNGIPAGTLCRAWVNFNGTGTVAIRASFNVTSVGDGGTGIYTVNFTNAMPDANYSVATAALFVGGPYVVSPSTSASYAAGSVSLVAGTTAGVAADLAAISVSIFR